MPEFSGWGQALCLGIILYTPGTCWWPYRVWSSTSQVLTTARYYLWPGSGTWVKGGLQKTEIIILRCSELTDRNRSVDRDNVLSSISIKWREKGLKKSIKKVVTEHRHSRRTQNRDEKPEELFYDGQEFRLSLEWGLGSRRRKRDNAAYTLHREQRTWTCSTHVRGLDPRQNYQLLRSGSYYNDLDELIKVKIFANKHTL